MFETQMRDDLDGTVFPARRYDTREAAAAYAKQRTAEKQCEITVRGDDGIADQKFRAGEMMETTAA